MVLSWPSDYDRDSHVIYAVDDNFRIVRCNPAWDTFALENNGSAARESKVRGVSLFAVIPQDLSVYYDAGFLTARKQGRWQHDFDCSSARVIRRLRMTVTPFGSGLLFRNVVVKDSLAPPSEAGGRFADYGRVITMCSHCRRVENKKSNVWQWVPEFIDGIPAEIGYRLCPACWADHYGEADRSGQSPISAA
ncbi:MAG: hypothetical protein ACJ74Y_07190 [Bryobacteraceae bacterium]